MLKRRTILIGMYVISNISYFYIPGDVCDFTYQIIQIEKELENQIQEDNAQITDKHLMYILWDMFFGKLKIHD